MVCLSSPPVITVVHSSFIQMAVTAPAWTRCSLGPERTCEDRRRGRAVPECAGILRVMLLLSRSHINRSPDCPPHSTELPSQQKHLHAHGTYQQAGNSILLRQDQNHKRVDFRDVRRCSAGAPHLCSSSAFTDDITIPVWTSVTFMQESAPTLRTCRLSEVVKDKGAFQVMADTEDRHGACLKLCRSRDQRAVPGLKAAWWMVPL